MKNKKLMISLFSLCLVAIVGLLTTVIVLAAGTQNVKTTINVTYSATNIEGTASAQYKIKNGTAVNMTTDGTANGGKTVSFKANNKTDNYTLSTMGNITLTADNNLVEFIYSFTSVEGGSYKATLATTGFDKNNYTIQYKVSEGNYSDTLPVNVAVNGTATTTITIKIEIKSSAIDVNASGSFVWTLTK